MSGEGFFEITTDVARFLGQIGARDGADKRAVAIVSTGAVCMAESVLKAR